MATPKTPRRRKPAESMRERTAKTVNAPQKKRRIRSTASRAGKPFAAVWSFIKKIARPFRFMLWPFKTRPVRFIGRTLASILLFRYFREAWKELKQVTWPSRQQTWQLTFAVFVFAIVFGTMIAVTDYGLDRLFRKILLQ